MIIDVHSHLGNILEYNGGKLIYAYSILTEIKNDGLILRNICNK